MAVNQKPLFSNTVIKVDRVNEFNVNKYELKKFDEGPEQSKNDIVQFRLEPRQSERISVAADLR